jgi:hypothetical protein
MYAFWVAVARLFTPEIAAFYETYYEKKGVNFIKGNVMASFEQDEFGKVCVIDLGWLQVQKSTYSVCPHLLVAFSEMRVLLPCQTCQRLVFPLYLWGHWTLTYTSNSEHNQVDWKLCS